MTSSQDETSCQLLKRKKNEKLVVTEGVHILFYFNIILLTHSHVLYKDYDKRVKIILKIIYFMLDGTYITRKVVYGVIYLLTAVGLSPGGSITVHMCTQTIHRTT